MQLRNSIQSDKTSLQFSVYKIQNTATAAGAMSLPVFPTFDVEEFSTVATRWTSTSVVLRTYALH